MSGTVTVFPESVSGQAGWNNVGGAASAAAALADGLDTTYATDNAAGSTHSLGLNMADPVLPAGAAVKSITPVLRASQPAGSTPLSCYAYVPGVIGGYDYQTPPGSWAPPNYIQSHVFPAGGALPSRVTYGWGDELDINAYLAKLGMIITGPAAADDHRVYQAYLSIAYVDAPVTSNLALAWPSEVYQTTRPRFVWDYASDEGLPQYEFRAAVWSEADLAHYPGGKAAFEAAGPDAIFGSHEGPYTLAFSFVGTDDQVHRAKAWTTYQQYGYDYAGRRQSTEQQWKPDQDIPGAGDYVVYVQAAAQYAGKSLEGPSVAKLEITMALSPPDPPSGLSASWEWPGAADPARRVPQYRTRVDVAVPAMDGLSGFDGRRVYVEHRAGAGPWSLLPLGMQEAGAGAGTLTFYDTYTAPGLSHSYRARTELYTGDGLTTLPSEDWAEGGPVVAEFDRFVLRDPLDPEGAVVLSIHGDLTGTRREGLGEYSAVGASLPTFVSDAIKGWEFQVKATLPGAGESDRIGALRAARSPLLFQGDGGGWYHWVRFGPDYAATVVRQALRRDHRVEVHEFTLKQSSPVHNQPPALA